MDERGFSATQMLVGFLAGAAAGAVAAYLTAPRPGREIREQLSRAAHNRQSDLKSFPVAVKEAYTAGSEAARQAYTDSLQSGRKNS